MNPEANSCTKFAHFEDNPNIIHIKDTQDDKLISSVTNRNNLNINSDSNVILEKIEVNNGNENRPPEIINEIPEDNITIENFESEEYIKSFLIFKNCISIIIAFMFISTFISLYLELNFSKEILFSVSTLLQVGHIVINIFRKRENKKFFLVEWLHIFFITCYIYLYVETDILKCSYSLITYPFVHIFYWYKIKNNENIQYLCFKLFARLLFFFQLLQICLKVDSYLNWDWNLVFWMFWVLAIMSTFYVMGLLILLSLTLYYKLSGHAENFQVFGLIWCFSNISNVVISSVIILKGLVQLLSKGEKDNLQKGLLIAFTWNLINFFYSGFFYKSIMYFFFYFPLYFLSKFIKILLFDKDQSNEETENGENLEMGKNKKYLYNIETTDKIPDNMPQFLMKFSSTYFQHSEITKDILNKLTFNSKKQKKPKKKSSQKPTAKKFERRSFEDPEKLKIKTSPEREKDMTNSTKEKHTEEIIKEKLEETHNISLNQSNINENDVSQDNQGNNVSFINQSMNQSLNQSVASCLICYEKQPDAVLMECGHGGLCYDCAIDIWKKNGECYLCRKEIVKILQIDIKGGTGHYKPIIKLSNLKREIVDESVIENNEDNEDVPTEEEPEQDPNISISNNNISISNPSNNNVDNQVLSYIRNNIN